MYVCVCVCMCVCTCMHACVCAVCAVVHTCVYRGVQEAGLSICIWACYCMHLNSVVCDCMQLYWCISCMWLYACSYRFKRKHMCVHKHPATKPPNHTVCTHTYTIVHHFILLWIYNKTHLKNLFYSCCCCLLLSWLMLLSAFFLCLVELRQKKLANLPPLHHWSFFFCWSYKFA